jgi:hypothetical protein
MKKFIIFSKLRSLFLKADKALGKYIEPRRGDYNFLDVVSNIKLTEAQINEEIHKHHQRNRQIPMLLTLVSLLFAYLPKIISYIFKNEIVGAWEYLLFGIYTLSLIAVVLFFFFFAYPGKIPHRYLPSQFYHDIFDLYRRQGYDDVESNKGVQYSYLSYLEEFLETYTNYNNSKERTFQWFMRLLPIAALLYATICTVVLLNDKTNVNKNEIMIIRGKKMKPSSAITVHPIVEREGTRIHYSLRDNIRLDVPQGKDTIKLDSLQRPNRFLKHRKTNRMVYKTGGISPEK